jgi:cell division GTPase FtsZ
VDEVLLRAVRGISDIINTSGLQNVDFADVKTTMSEKGMTMMGTGESKGENRAEEAVNKALNSPLLDNISIKGATGLLFNITTSSNFPLRRDELKIIAQTINAEVSPDVKSKFGVVEDDNMGEVIRVTVIATGFENLGNKKTYTRTMREDELFPTESHRMNTPPRVNSDGVRSKDFIRKETPQGSPYLFEKPITPADLTDLGQQGYINEGNFPGMRKHMLENDEDELDIPTFQREKKLE